MPVDCRNTVSSHGRNATPLCFIESARYVLGSIELDIASDAVINASVQADCYYSLVDDGFNKAWVAKTAFLNAPGSTVTGGTYADRLFWLSELKKPSKKRAAKPSNIRQIKASDWHRELFGYYKAGLIKNAIALIYRGGSLGSLPAEMLRYPLCITCGDMKGNDINGSGRIGYEQITERGKRVAQDKNTQGSVFVLLSESDEVRSRFSDEFEKYGVVK